MCWCDPRIRTPVCDKPNCNPFTTLMLACRPKSKTLRCKIEELINELNKRKDEAEKRCRFVVSAWHQSRACELGVVIDELERALREEREEV